MVIFILHGAISTSMKNRVFFFDRTSGKVEQEKIYGQIFLEFLYGNNRFCRAFAKLIRPILSKLSLMSRFYGWIQTQRFSKKKIRPFIEKFHIDVSEFEKKINGFENFNDFFIRKLKPSARPIDWDSKSIVMPADGRYLVVENLSDQQGFFVKGQKFNLSKLLKNDGLVQKYKEGSLVLARLCPTDYHRFHFPCDGIAKKTKLINGFLYSVNPLALRKRLKILWQNKREMTLIQTEHFGEILFVEVGATFVGSIKQTFKENSCIKKGEEKGFFEFGGSSVIMLFEKNRVEFEKDLKLYSKQGLEVRALFGQRLGKVFQP